MKVDQTYFDERSEYHFSTKGIMHLINDSMLLLLSGH